MKLGIALRELHRGEDDLAHELLQVSDRHKVDHDIFYVAQDLARWSQDHVRRIAAVAVRYGVELDPEPAGESRLARRVLDKGSELVGRARYPALLLLRDVRGIYLKASGVYVDWELVAQAAQGVRDRELLDVAHACMPETQRTVKWANGKLKESATQALVS